MSEAGERVLPDLVRPGLAVLFCGINPGLYSARTGHHFARPGNRFWPALHRSGFTPRQLHPSEQRVLLGLGLGLTNVVGRPSASAAELTPAELVDGGIRLRALVHEARPRWLAVLGVTAYRVAFGMPRARFGEQDSRIGDTGIWVLPNPSGLNAHHSLSALTARFAALRAAAGLDQR